MAILSILGKVLGSDKGVDSLLDKDKGLLVRAGGWVNDLHYSDAEKAENSLLVREWGIKQLEALEPFKIVQRIIAFSVLLLWLTVGLNVVAAIWIEAITRPKVCLKDAICSGIDVATPMLQFAMSDYVFWPVLAVLGLYVGGGAMPSRSK